MKTKFVVGLAVLLGCALAAVIVIRRPAAPSTVKVERPVNRARPATAPVEAPSSPEQSQKIPQPQPVKPAAQNNPRQPPAKAIPQAQEPSFDVTPVPEPLARAALSFVGGDPDAEWVWYQAINDPRLSADERQNLIEDLNEDGFPDPDNPTADDLALIESRLAIIEQLGPASMDEVNAAAFEEAYKDLTNMYRRVTGL